MSAPSIKKTLYISTTPAASVGGASPILSAYTALDWDKVNGVVSIGQIGFQHNLIDIPDLESGMTKRAKGARNGTNGQIAIRTITGDVGQAELIVANEQPGDCSIQIVDPDGTNAIFWTGVLTSLMDNEASTTSYEGKSFAFTPNYQFVRGAADIT